jgi:hypothetical protein
MVGLVAPNFTNDCQPGHPEGVKALQRCRLGYAVPPVHEACARKVLLFDGPRSKPFRGRVCEHEIELHHLTEVLVMADQQQGDSTQGTAGSGDGAPRPLKTHPARPGEKADAGSNSGASVPGSNAGPQGRPGSDPKNPGDFGHR